MMRTTHARLGLWALLALLAVAAGADAGTVSDSYGGLVEATLEGPDGPVATGDSFDLVTTATRLSYGALYWHLYEDAAWSYDSEHGVVVVGGALVAWDYWFSRSTDIVTHTLDRPAGTYRYTLVVSNGFAHSRQAVAVDYEVTVADPVLGVELDIHPTSCPNPLNPASKGKGVVPVAILGTSTFDAADVDPATVRLEGVAPLRAKLQDVTAPVVEREDGCDCTTDGPDGWVDLTLKFDRRALVAALGPLADGDVLTLTVTGMLYDGTAFEGRDCVVIRAHEAKPPKAPKPPKPPKKK